MWLAVLGANGYLQPVNLSGHARMACSVMADAKASGVGGRGGKDRAGSADIGDIRMRTRRRDLEWRQTAITF